MFSQFFFSCQEKDGVPTRQSQAMGLAPGPSLGRSSVGGTWCSAHLLNTVSEEEMEELLIQLLFRLFSPILAKIRYGSPSVLLFPPSVVFLQIFSDPYSNRQNYLDLKTHSHFLWGCGFFCFVFVFV